MSLKNLWFIIKIFSDLLALHRRHREEITGLKKRIKQLESQVEILTKKHISDKKLS
jgi:hypothetical protein